MALLKTVLSVLACVSTLGAVVIPSHHAVHEKRGNLHPRWARRDRVPPHKLLPMRIGLAQSNLDVGYEHLMEV